MAQKKEYRYIYGIALIIIILLYGIRIINIDQDIAPWGVSMYQPADEGPYSFMAINERVYGSVRPEIVYNDQVLPNYISDNFITNIIGNGLTTLCFGLFGNNYYGLRMPYVFIGLLNLIVFWLMLRRIRIIYGKRDNKEIVLELALLLWMVVDFSFFNAGRVVEPTSVRLLFVQLVICVFIMLPESHKLRFLLIGLLVTFSCFLVYITNAFLFLAVFACIIFNAIKDNKRNTKTELFWFCIGSAIMFFIAECYYYFIWNTEAITNSLNTVLAFAGNSSAELTTNSGLSLPHTLILIYARIVSSNAFFYNMPLLFSACICVVPILRYVKKKHDRNMLFMVLVVGAFLCQTIVSADTITRKSIVISTVMISVLYAALLSGALSCDVSTTRKRIKTIFVFIFASLNILLSFVYRSFIYDWTEKDFDLTTEIILAVCQVIPILLFSSVEIGRILKDKLSESYSLNNNVAIVSITIACICSILLIAKYYWVNPSFSERDSMIELSNQVNGKYVLGQGFQLGYSLYNDMKPIVNTNEGTLVAAKILGDCLYFDYEFDEDSLDAYIKKYFYPNRDEDLDFVPIHIVKREYKVYGKARNMCLYQIKK